MGCKRVLSRDGKGNDYSTDRIIFENNFKKPSIIVDDFYQPEEEPTLVSYKEFSGTNLNTLGLAVFTLKQNWKVNPTRRPKKSKYAFLEKLNYKSEEQMIRKIIIPKDHKVIVDIANGYAWLIGRRAKPVRYVKVDKKLIAKRKFQNIQR